MLHDDQRTCAPRCTKVSINTAVWIVICKQPAMRAPFNGFFGPYSSRMAIRPAFQFRQSRFLLRPPIAKAMSLTLKSWAADRDTAAAE